MRSTGINVMSVAVSAYDNKPREAWLFDYPGNENLCFYQLSLSGIVVPYITGAGVVASTVQFYAA